MIDPKNKFKSSSDSSKSEDKNFINLYGKVAAFPKPIKASNAYKYLEAVKVNKNKLWYIIIQQQANELQMIKYNNKAGVNLNEFVSQLIDYYIKEFTDLRLVESIKNICVEGADMFATIKNIPVDVKIEGKPLVARIAEDLIKLLRDNDLNEKSND